MRGINTHIPPVAIYAPEDDVRGVVFQFSTARNVGSDDGRLLSAAEDASWTDARQHRQPKSTDQQQLEAVDAGQLSACENEHQLRQPGKKSS